MFVLDCATPCRFLGNSENEPQQIGDEAPVKNTVESEQKPEKNKITNSPVSFCSACNIEMVQTRTKLKIDGWQEAKQESPEENSRLIGEDELPVIVYLCPKCGKLDFRAEEK